MSVEIHMNLHISDTYTSSHLSTHMSLRDMTHIWVMIHMDLYISDTYDSSHSHNSYMSHDP